MDVLPAAGVTHTALALWKVVPVAHGLAQFWQGGLSDLQAVLPQAHTGEEAELDGLQQHDGVDWKPLVQVGWAPHVLAAVAASETQ